MNFYEELWANPIMQYIVLEWAKKKMKNPEDGLPKGDDLRILGVAVDHNQSCTELVTFDNDFIVLSEWIMK